MVLSTFKPYPMKQHSSSFDSFEFGNFKKDFLFKESDCPILKPSKNWVQSAPKSFEGAGKGGGKIGNFD